MKPDALRVAFKTFFKESDPGQHFIKKVLSEIDSQHQKAEKDPELARDYTQRAKGMREVLELIQSTMAERGKPKNSH